MILPSQVTVWAGNLRLLLRAGGTVGRAATRPYGARLRFGASRVRPSLGKLPERRTPPRTVALRIRAVVQTPREEKPVPLARFASMAFLLVLAVAACGGGGARSDTDIKNTTVSRGQALMDLKRAYDSGAMSQSEYERERQRILDE